MTNFPHAALIVVETLARRIADLEEDVAMLTVQRDHDRQCANEAVELAGEVESLREALRTANQQVARLRQDNAELAGTADRTVVDPGGGQ